MSENLKEIIKKHVNTLKNTPLFHDFSLEELIRFLVVWKHQKLGSGEVIFTEGDESSSMAILLTMAVDIYKKKTLICSLQSPAIIGEIGLFTGSPRNATVKAANDCIILTITQNELTTFCSKDFKLSNKIHRNIILCLRNKINNDNQQILTLQSKLLDKDEEVIKLKVILKTGGAGKIDVKSEMSDEYPMEKRLSRNDRKCIRVAISHPRYCYMIWNKMKITVKDLSLGGLSVDLPENEEALDMSWQEGSLIDAELFLKGSEPFPFSGTVRNRFPTTSGLQLRSLNNAQEKAIIKTVNELQRLGQVI